MGIKYQVGQVIEYKHEEHIDLGQSLLQISRNIRKGVIVRLAPGYAPDVIISTYEDEELGLMESEVLRICTIDSVINIIKEKDEKVLHIKKGNGQPTQNAFGFGRNGTSTR